MKFCLWFVSLTECYLIRVIITIINAKFFTLFRFCQLSYFKNNDENVKISIHFLFKTRGSFKISANSLSVRNFSF